MNTFICGEERLLKPTLFMKVGLCSILFLALFTFFFLRQSRSDRLELGMVATKSIVTPVDLQLLDEEATRQMKMEAAGALGMIYQIDSAQISSLALPPNSSPKAVEWLTRLQQKLWEMRFTDALTAEEITKADPTEKDRLVIVSFFSLDRALSLPHPFWIQLTFNAPVDKAWLDSLEQRLWRLQPDMVMRQRLQKFLADQVPIQHLEVPAGTVLVRKGEPVSAKQLALVQAMQTKLQEEKNLLKGWRLLGSALLSAIFIAVAIFYLFKEHPQVLRSKKELFLLSTVLVVTLILVKGIDTLALTVHGGTFLRGTLFAPFAAILLTALFNRRLALFGAFWCSGAFAIGLTGGGLPLFIANFLPAAVAILAMRFLYRRKAIFIVCLQAAFIAFVTLLGLDLYFQGVTLELVTLDLLNALFFMLLTAILVIAVLPLFESTFDVLTEMTLMEYIDPSHPLLHRLMLEAPGTYQHSVVVGNLAEAAALAIGANSLFCRVSTLYHDIGKLIAPQYFTENQLPGVNVHQLLTPLESAQVIISHVIEGVEMGRKARLPESFISIIQEHHGTQLVYYFYHKQMELVQGRSELVNEADFRYKGPKPHSKESAIIMIADSLEAASRSLEVFDLHSVTRLVDKLVAEKAEDRQFEECNLTFEELSIVKKTLAHTLLSASHMRLKYPQKRVAESD